MSIIESVRESIGRAASEYIYDNPVVAKELRTRMRGRKAFAIMGAYVVLVSVIVLIYFWIASASDPVVYASSAREIGGMVFLTLHWVQVFLLALIIPALTSGAISFEIEKRTIEMLALSRLTPGRIVMGKLLSGVLYGLMLLVSTLPLAGLCLLFGMISPAEIAVTYLLMVCWVFLFSAVGVFWSSIFDRTAVSGLFTYAACFGYVAITSLVGGGFLGSFLVSGGRGGGGYGITGDIWPLVALCPGWTPMVALAHANVCGVHLPVALIAAVLTLGLGIFLVLLSIMHVKYKRAETSLPARIILLIITTAVVWLILGDKSLAILSNLSPGNLAHTIVPMGIIIPLFLGLCASGFATGPVRRRAGESVLHYALTPWKALRGDLGGGITFMFLWGVLLYGTFGVTVWWASKAFAFKVLPSFWVTYCKMAFPILAVVLAVSCMGVLMSTLTTMRRNAAVIVMLFLVVIYAGYLVILMNYAIGMSNPHNPIWQLAILWPVTPLTGIVYDWNRGMPAFWWGKQNSWLAVGCVYMVISFGALLLASRAKQGGGVQED
jgi:ABC-type transport system involved in multi-copper enzyme maturation permease subunit